MHKEMVVIHKTGGEELGTKMLMQISLGFGFLLHWLTHISNREIIVVTALWEMPLIQAKVAKKETPHSCP